MLYSDAIEPRGESIFVAMEAYPKFEFRIRVILQSESEVEIYRFWFLWSSFSFSFNIVSLPVEKTKKNIGIDI